MRLEPVRAPDDRRARAVVLDPVEVIGGRIRRQRRGPARDRAGDVTPRGVAAPRERIIAGIERRIVDPRRRRLLAHRVAGRGLSGARISEHAFGNALDIAAFVLANGHRITVKDGWRGAPEEQGFLRDVQAAACDQFTTVLAPGSNQFHYDHIHVDLMRRDSGRRICQPGAVDGELVAARARKGPALAARSFEPPPTRRYDPPVEAGSDPFAWRGDMRPGDPDTTSSIGGRKVARPVKAEEDLDWIEEPGPRPGIDWSDRHKVR